VSESHLYNKYFSPDLHEVKVIRAEVGRILVKLNVQKHYHNKILLALSEYLTNLVKHSKPKTTKVSVDIVRSNDGLSFIIQDDGGYFTGLERGITFHQPPQFDESGMGLDIIFHLFPLSLYSRKGKQNVFKFSLCPNEINSSNVIAIIDDEPMQRTLLTSYLSEQYSVVSYQDGQDFLMNMSKERFDLVICDIEMPNIDGLAVKSALQNDPEMSQVPFIFLTANDDPKMEVSASELGIDNYLTKPISKERLLMSIERTLIRNRQLSHQSHKVFNNALKPNILNNNNYYSMALKTLSPEIGGGDFVVQKSFANREILILADVMGHDATSKLFAHSFDGYIKGLIEQTADIRIADIFTLLSKQVFNDPLLSEMLLTCVGIELNENYIDLVSAGHPSPKILSNKSIEEVSLVGRLPGVCADTSYCTKRINLVANQRMLLFTDGFLDWAESDQQSSLFLDAIAKLNEKGDLLSVEQLSDAIYSELISYCGELNDDMTFIVVEKD